MRGGGGIVQYIGLGDSISIDDYPDEELGGYGFGAISLLHQNKDEVWPEFQGLDLVALNPHTRLFNLAVDGATTLHVLGFELPLLPPDAEGRTLVTLTAGGNDLLQIAGVRDVRGAGTPAQIERNLKDINNHLRSRYDDCLIVLGTIYDPTDGKADLYEEGRVEGELLKILHETNERIRGLEEQQRVRVVDIHKHFLGHGVPFRCRNTEDLHRDPNWWYRLTIEPNSRGASEVRRLFWESLRAGQTPNMNESSCPATHR